MTGPEHYREAERQLEWVNGTKPGTDDDGVRVRLDMAQVHATLVLGAAALGLDDSDNWPAVTS
jgi:hypothetical protein